MKHRILAAVALTLTTGGTAALAIEGLPTWGKVAACMANALGTGLALAVQPRRKAAPDA